MEAVDAAATFAAVKQKLNRTPFNDWLLSSTPTEPDESCVTPSTGASLPADPENGE
jgi:hypothetical protein